MKTIPVKDVAEALDISTRAVLLRREKGHLKGILIKNERGSDEYRIYPTKEIIEGLRRIGSPLVATAEALAEFNIEVRDLGPTTAEREPNTAGATTAVAEKDITDVDSLSDDQTKPTFGADDTVSSSFEPMANWTEKSRAAANGMAEDLWNNVISKFLTTLEQKDQLIGEMRTEIKEKERQLLLLPDLESQAKKAEEAQRLADNERQRAKEAAQREESERIKAQTIELEAEALKKQIGLLQVKIETSSAPELERQLETEKASKQAEVNRLQSELDDARRDKELEVKALEEKLASIEEYKKVSEESQRKLDDLQKTLEERNQAELEKASETAAIRAEMSLLSAKLQAVKDPWWSRIFNTTRAGE